MSSPQENIEEQKAEPLGEGNGDDRTDETKESMEGKDNGGSDGGADSGAENEGQDAAPAQQDEDTPGDAADGEKSEEEATGNTSDDQQIPDAETEEDKAMASEDEVIEEEVIEEEYYEEEEYEEEEVIEEIVDEGLEAIEEEQPLEGDARASLVSSELAPAKSDPDGKQGHLDAESYPSVPGSQASSREGEQASEVLPFGSTPSSVSPQPYEQEEDIENNRSAAVAPSPQDQYADQVRKPEAEKSSSICYWLVVLLVLGLLGGGAYLGWYLVNENDEQTPSLEDDDMNPPTMAPTTGRNTAFDPIRGHCNFIGLQNPHVVDQCNCAGEIQVVADDIVGRYNHHKDEFIPKLYRDYDDEIESCSPRNQALVWLSSANDFEFTDQERTVRFALAALFAGLRGLDWTQRQDWLEEIDACEWNGVDCNQNGEVEYLVLEGNNVAGEIAPEIVLLESLYQLHAARNEIGGAIPGAMFSTAPLEVVDLSFNRLTGPVPPTVGDAKSLRELNLENNLLSGRLSKQLGGALSLKYLNLGNNDLVGELPVEFFDLTNLTRLDLRANGLAGLIPSDIANLQNLTSLGLGPNSFMGDIPTEIGDLTNLEILTMRELPFLGGRLPVSYGQNLKELVELTIRDTQVGGILETFFGDLPKLVKLDLSGNDLRGPIPSELGNLKELSVLDLSNNFMDSPIPPALADLESLTEMNLNDNVFVGRVPDSFGSLEELQILRLDGNHLTGRVANEICDLRDVDLFEFIVDCPTGEEGGNLGVTCTVPTCCTSCRTEISV